MPGGMPGGAGGGGGMPGGMPGGAGGAPGGKKIPFQFIIIAVILFVIMGGLLLQVLAIWGVFTSGLGLLKEGAAIIGIGGGSPGGGGTSGGGGASGTFVPNYTLSGQAVILNVPFEVQRSGVWCGRASQQMVLNYLDPNRTNCRSQEQCQLSAGVLGAYKYQCFNGNDNDAVEAAKKAILDKKKPVIAYTDFSTAAGHHIIVLIGYDPVNDLFIINNPAHSTGAKNTDIKATKMACHAPSATSVYNTTAANVAGHLCPQACKMQIPS